MAQPLRPGRPGVQPNSPEVSYEIELVYESDELPALMNLLNVASEQGLLAQLVASNNADETPQLIVKVDGVRRPLNEVLAAIGNLQAAAAEAGLRV